MTVRCNKEHLEMTHGVKIGSVYEIADEKDTGWEAISNQKGNLEICGWRDSAKYRKN